MDPKNADVRVDLEQLLTANLEELEERTAPSWGIVTVFPF